MILFSQLEYLDLSYNKITDNGARILSKCLHNVKILELLETEISEAGAAMLKKTIDENNVVETSVWYLCGIDFWTVFSDLAKNPWEKENKNVFCVFVNKHLQCTSSNIYHQMRKVYIRFTDDCTLVEKVLV